MRPDDTTPAGEAPAARRGGTSGAAEKEATAAPGASVSIAPGGSGSAPPEGGVPAAPTLGDAVAAAVERLRASGSESARLDAELLAGHAIGVDRTAVLAHPEVPLPPHAAERLAASVERRARGEPVAYIRGLKEFHGIAFAVDARALIPRPETELLVDIGAARITGALQSQPRSARSGRYRVIDVGTGSGAVAVALAAVLRRRGSLRDVELVATDLSSDALGVALENAVVHGLADAIRLETTDLLPAGDPPFDLLLANLPYVPSADVSRLPVAASFEPPLALDGGPDGLAVVRRLLARLPGALAPGGIALLEIGAGQSEVVRRDVDDLGEWSVVFHADLAGIPRVAEVARLRREDPRRPGAAVARGAGGDDARHDGNAARRVDQAAR